MLSPRHQRDTFISKPSLKRGRRFLLIGSIIALTLFFLLDSPVDPSRRILVANTPITRRVKNQFQELQSLADNLQVDKEQPFNILALGGSVTWAEGLNTRTNAYPHVLGRLLHPNPTVDNLAIKAEGAAMPARCLETLTTNSTQGFVSGDILSMKSKPYHLIILEFSLTGPQEVKQLVVRLHQRYPDAVIVYVHLHTKASREDEFENMLQTYVAPSFMTKKIKAHVFTMPWGQETQTWYAKDGIHMNVLGHLMVTTGILRILQDDSFDFRPRVGDWKIRDACVSWFLSGKLPTESCVWAGGHISEFNPAGGKFAYEIREKATLTVTNPFPRSVPLGLTFMVRGKGGMYPRVLVDIEGRGPKPITLVPEQDQMSHLQMTHDVGLLKPGENIVHFEVIQKTPWPLRVTGFSLLYNTKDVQHEDIPLTLIDGILDNVESEVGDLLRHVPADQLQNPTIPPAKEGEESEEEEEEKEGKEEKEENETVTNSKEEKVGLEEKRLLQEPKENERDLAEDENRFAGEGVKGYGVRLEAGETVEVKEMNAESAARLYDRGLKEPISVGPDEIASGALPKYISKNNKVEGERDLKSELNNNYDERKVDDGQERELLTESLSNKNNNDDRSIYSSEKKYESQERDLKTESVNDNIYDSEKKYDSQERDLKAESVNDNTLYSSEKKYDSQERDLKAESVNSNMYGSEKKYDNQDQERDLKAESVNDNTMHGSEKKYDNQDQERDLKAESVNNNNDNMYGSEKKYVSQERDLKAESVNNNNNNNNNDNMYGSEKKYVSQERDLKAESVNDNNVYGSEKKYVSQERDLKAESVNDNNVYGSEKKYDSQERDLKAESVNDNNVYGSEKKYDSQERDLKAESVNDNNVYGSEKKYVSQERDLKTESVNSNNSEMQGSEKNYVSQERDLKFETMSNNMYGSEKKYDSQERDLKSESTSQSSSMGSEKKYDDKARDLKSESMSSASYSSKKKYDDKVVSASTSASKYESRKYNENDRDLKSKSKSSGGLNFHPSDIRSSSMTSSRSSSSKVNEKGSSQPSKSSSSMTYLYDQVGAQETMKAKSFMDDHELDRRLKLGSQ